MKSRIFSRLASSIVTVIVLSLCLCVTSMALLYVTVSVDDNRFHTGSVEINLNDNKAIIEADEFMFEPGMTVEKSFFIENLSTDPRGIYYKLFFDNVDGGLDTMLDITIKDGEKVLYNGTAAQLQRNNVAAADDLLHLGEKRELTILFHLPEEAGNSAEDQYLSFDFCAQAVQSKNNPLGLFE